MVPIRRKAARGWIGLLTGILILLVSCDSNSPNEQTVDSRTPLNRWSTDEAWSILQAQDQRDISTLCGFLKDTTWQVRRAAALAFASVRNGEAVDCLKPALNDRQAAVRAAAAFAMGLCGNTDANRQILWNTHFRKWWNCLTVQCDHLKPLDVCLRSDMMKPSSHRHLRAPGPPR